MRDFWWGGERLTDATWATVRDEKKEPLYVCAWYYYIHRWRAVAGRPRTRLWPTCLVSPLACRDSLHRMTPLIDRSMHWLIEQDWPVTPGRGHPPGRRSCWKLCWMFRCFACAVRSLPGSPESQRGFRGTEGGGVMERSQRKGKEKQWEEIDYWSDTSASVMRRNCRITAWCLSAWSYIMFPKESVSFATLPDWGTNTLSVWPDQAPNGQHQWHHSSRDLPV